MEYQYIRTEEVQGVLVITLSDGPTRNALSNEMSGEITDSLDRFELDKDLRALVITGNDPAFCSGANLRKMNQKVEEKKIGDDPKADIVSPWERMEAKWMKTKPDMQKGTIRYLPLRIFNLQKPTIAAVNGYAMGVGMGLALSCDIRIASEDAKVSEAFIRSGLVPADGSCWHLPRMIGLSNTLFLQFTGDIVDAQECYRLGIVNKVVPHKDLMKTALELAKRLAQGATYSIGLTKWLVHKSLNVDLEESLALSGAAQEVARQTEDYKEGVRAFGEKRKPVFHGK